VSALYKTFIQSFPTRRSSDLMFQRSIFVLRQIGTSQGKGCQMGTLTNKFYLDKALIQIMWLIGFFRIFLGNFGECNRFGMLNAISEEHTSELHSRFDHVCRLL